MRRNLSDYFYAHQIPPRRSKEFVTLTTEERKIRNITIDEINRKLQFQKEDFPDLHQAVENDSLIVFLGAGISKLYGCLLWNEMALKLVDELQKYKIISYAEQNILSQEAVVNPRKVMSICHARCSIAYNDLGVYEKAIRDSVDIQDNSKVQEIYKRVYTIQAMSHLTTNIDLGIKQYALSIRNIARDLKIYDCTSPHDQDRIRQIEYNVFKDGNIIYLHGTQANIQECILPIEKYLSYYNEQNDFLNGLFEKIKSIGCIIVFIGYGLNEWDLIERVYKIKSFPMERIAYLLSPIYTYEIIKFNLESAYFRSFGVEPIPYIIDNEGYEELYYVLDNLANATDKSRPSPYTTISDIEEA